MNTTNENDRTSRLGGQAILSFAGETTARVKSGLAVHHLVAAEFFSERARQMEESLPSPPTETQRSEHRAYVLGAIFTATAFLEALINELYLSAVDGSPLSEFGLEDSNAAAMAQAWLAKEGKGKFWRLRDKYNKALMCCKRAPYEKESAAFTEVGRLVNLRNAVTHYKPEWDDSLRKHAEIAADLEGQFPENRFASTSQTFFPHRCLGAGCAAWALSASMRFAIDFWGRMGLRETFVIDREDQQHDHGERQQEPENKSPAESGAFSPLLRATD